MADHGTRPLATETTCWENSQNGPGKGSKGHGCSRSVIPVFSILACLGIVLFVAGITSLAARGAERGGVILVGVGGFVFSVFFMVAVELKRRAGLRGCATWRNYETQLVQQYSSLQTYTAENISSFTGYQRSLHLIPDCNTPGNPPSYEDVTGYPCSLQLISDCNTPGNPPSYEDVIRPGRFGFPAPYSNPSQAD